MLSNTQAVEMLGHRAFEGRVEDMGEVGLVVDLGVQTYLIGLNQRVADAAQEVVDVTGQVKSIPTK